MAALKITGEQIQVLKSQLQDHATVLTPGSTEYEVSLKLWSAIGFQRSGVTVCPTDAQGIAKTVKFAQGHQIDLAIKGGGHSTDTSASSDGGILIDLSRMKQIWVDPVTKTVTAQAGALWADVDQANAQYNLAVVGGTVSHTGIGGLSLRGGYGYLTPQYGLTIDNLLAAKVVTADGSVLEASAEENPDLFWALRGAGSTVGVVIEFVFQAHPQPNLVWNGTRTYSCDLVPEVIQALNAALVHPQGRAAAQCFFSLSPDTGDPIVTTVLFFNGSEKEGKGHFAGLLALDCVTDNVEMREYSEVNNTLNAMVPPGGQKMLIGVQMASPVQPKFASEIMEEFKHRLNTESDMAQSSLEIDYFDPSQICRHGTTESAFPARNTLLRGAIMLQWTDPRKNDYNLSWGKRIRTMFEDELRRGGHEPDKLVSNFVGYTRGDKVTPADMFGVNADRLLEIKAKYDESNIFNKLNPLNGISS
ncbi:hypothetical protein N7504_005018 [Penicillium tannophilum]|nr:hypothetical protein N7504_005018 [Penicillium tannophilum]